MCSQTTPRTNIKKNKITETEQDASLIPTLAVQLWMGWNGGIPFLVILICIVPSTTFKSIVLSILILSLLLPPQFPGSLGSKIGGWICQNAKKYFGLKTTIEDYDQIQCYSDENKAIIFACEPHDILPYSVFCFNKALQILPGKVSGTVLMTTAVFRIPIMRQIYSWLGAHSVDKSTFRHHLQNGRSLAFCPGGVQEVMYLDDPDAPHEIALYLQSRKGFIKLALESGSPIVPVFTFHLDGSFGYFLPRGKAVGALARTIGFLPIFFWGRFGIPLGIPYPKKLSVVFGRAIDVPKVDKSEVTNELVNKYHEIFVEEMIDLFERHKLVEGYGHRTLKIL